MAIQSALIVDDSKLARMTLRKKLQRHGVEAAVAESAREALEMIKTNRPQIVFMDHLMPDMDGFEATKVIRNMPGMGDLPIVMCTGKDHEGYLAEAQSIGANSTLAKPPTEDSLSAILAMDFTRLVGMSDKASVDVADLSLGAGDVMSLVDEAVTDSTSKDAAVIDLSADFDFDVSFDADNNEADENLDDESLDDLLSGLLGESDPEVSIPELDVPPFVSADLPDTHAGIDAGEVAELSPAADDSQVVDSAYIAGIVDAQFASVERALMQSVERVMATSVNDAVGNLSASLHKNVLADVTESVQKDVASQIAAIPSTLTPEAINKLMVQKMQLLWKKTNITINERVGALKTDMAVQHDALLKQVEESMSVPTLGSAEDEGGLLAGNVDDQIRAMQIELAEAKSSIRAAKVIGFIGFISGAAAVGYLAANFLGYI